MLPIGPILAAILLLLANTAHTDNAELVAKGETLLRVAGCIACHTDPMQQEALLAGGRAIKSPQGIFYSPNITPHPEHGIGGWTENDLARALMQGVSPEGHHYYPAFPYTSYTGMRRDDIRALKAYLDSVPPVDKQNRPHELRWYVSRSAVWIWKKLFFQPREFMSRDDKSSAWNRGAYLVEAVSHCAECHSPRNNYGAIIEAMRLAGTSKGPEDEATPNITPHKQTGIGNWSGADLAYYLRTGADPDGDYAGGLMGEVIDEGLSHLSPEDTQAIVTYLQSLQPIEHSVSNKPPEPASASAFYE